MGQLEPRLREGRWKAGQPVCGKLNGVGEHQERSPCPPALLLLSQQGIFQASSFRRCKSRHAARPLAPSVLGGRAEGPEARDGSGHVLSSHVLSSRAGAAHSHGDGSSEGTRLAAPHPCGDMVGHCCGPC